tara:strand:- start:141 stop:794 length:654 start_codon:yes stop_codon:yes gene_type:complete
MHSFGYYLQYLGFYEETLGMSKETYTGGAIYFKLFDLGGERTIPAWFSTCILWSCGMGLLAISVLEQDKSLNRYWFIIGLSLIYVSLDEMISIHEHGDYIGVLALRNNINIPDFLNSSWVIPAIVLVVIFFVFLIPFFAKLERQIRLLLIVSAIIYLFGAVGFEMVGGYARVNSLENLYKFAFTIEETLEMSGAILLFHVVTSVALHKYKEFALNSA